MSPSMEKTPSVISSFLPGWSLMLARRSSAWATSLWSEDLNLGAGQAGAVDDDGVVQLVGDDEVFFAQHRRHRAGIGGESGLEDHAGFDVFEARDLLFQLHVDFHGAGDGAHRA